MECLRPLPLSSLRLLVPPLRLMSAAMWQVARQRSPDRRHYGMLEDFVSVATESIPDLLTDRQRTLLLLSLRAKMTQEVFSGDPCDPQPEVIQKHLDRIQAISMETYDVLVNKVSSSLTSLVQNMIVSPKERERLLQEVLDQRFEAGLQALLCDFLSKLEQTLPTPSFKQAASWLDAAPSGLEDCLQEVESKREELMSLLTNQSCREEGTVTTMVGSSAEDRLLSAWLRPRKTDNASKPTNHCLPAKEDPVVIVQPGACASEPVSPGREEPMIEEEVVEVLVTQEEQEQEVDEIGQSELSLQQGGGAHGWSPPGGKLEEEVTGDVTSDLRDHIAALITPQKKTQKLQLALSERDRLCDSDSSTDGHHAEDTYPYTNTVDQSEEASSPVDQSEEASSPATPLALQRLAHKCPLCGKCFIYRSQVVRHMHSHKSGGGGRGRAVTHKPLLGGSSSPSGGFGGGLRVGPLSSRHTCFQCGVAFRGKAELAAHMVAHRPRPPAHQCSQCGRRFRLLSSLTNHKQTHGASGEAGFACKRCERVFVSARERASHRQTHRVATMPCPVCQQPFTSQSRLLQHQLQAHPVTDGGEPRFDCRHCEQSFNGVTQLRIHQRSHTLRSFQCDQCSKAFSTLGGLTSHRGSHSGDKPYLCPQCGKTFRTKDGLEGHLRTHTGEKPYRCAWCSKAFTALAGLNVHVRRHTGERPYVCTVCGKGWPSGGDLQKHMRSHTGERPYSCQECGKAFSISCHLTEHMRSHTGEKPFSCPQCGKCVKRKFDLKKHMLSHSDVRPYPCQYCSKSYTRKTHLNRHLLTHTA